MMENDYFCEVNVAICMLLAWNFMGGAVQKEKKENK